MKKMRVTYLFVTTFLLFPALSYAQEPSEEISSDVPALSAFHEVIYPLWHQAWAEKNFALVKDLMPKVKDHMKELEKAELPGILRDKKQAWERGIKEIGVSVAKLEVAVAKEDKKATFDAVEVLHRNYERQMSIVRPPLQELEDYHVLLYQVYHHYMPKKNIPAIKKASKEMAAACEKLGGAIQMKDLKVKDNLLRAETAKLCEATDELVKATAKKKSKLTVIKATIERVHTQYQNVAKFFE
jgi:hypothetical protein